MDEQFPDVKPFPAVKGAPPEPYHNQPPLEDRLMMQFDEALFRKGLTVRVAEIAGAAQRAPEIIADDEDAGRVGDLLAQAKAVHQAIDAEREVLNRPLLNAQRALKGKADALALPMDNAVAPLRELLDKFVASKPEAVAHGEMGARVGSRTDWDFEIVDLARLPMSIRRHPEVLAAMEKVIRSLIRGGAREIPGVLIREAKHVVIR